jgi:hypothetical protein
MEEVLCFVETFSLYIFHDIKFSPSTKNSTNACAAARETFCTLWQCLRTLTIYCLRMRPGDPQHLKQAALGALDKFAQTAEQVTLQAHSDKLCTHLHVELFPAWLVRLIKLLVSCCL